MKKHRPLAFVRHWAASLVTTIGLLFLIAGAVGEETWEVSFAMLFVIGLAATLLHWLFPGGRFFALVFANAIGLYACIYVSFIETSYEDVNRSTRLFAFYLPILTFAVGVYFRRERIRAVVSLEHAQLETRFGRAFAWLVPVFLVGISNFLAPLDALGPEQKALWLFGAMSIIALVTLFASFNIAVFLIDTGLLFEDFFETIAVLVKPAFAFVTVYSLMVVLFATAYRLIGRFDDSASFLIHGRPADLSFVESLYFSLVTVSTVGYGDIVPLSYSVRVVVALQVVCSVVLLLFGFHAIMRQAVRGS